MKAGFSIKDYLILAVLLASGVGVYLLMEYAKELGMSVGDSLQGVLSAPSDFLAWAGESAAGFFPGFDLTWLFPGGVPSAEVVFTGKSPDGLYDIYTLQHPPLHSSGEMRTYLNAHFITPYDPVPHTGGLFFDVVGQKPSLTVRLLEWIEYTPYIARATHLSNIGYIYGGGTANIPSTEPVEFYILISEYWYIR